MLRSPNKNSIFEAPTRTDKTVAKPQVDHKRLSPRNDLHGGPQLSKENTITYSQDLTHNGPKPGVFAIELMNYIQNISRSKP